MKQKVTVDALQFLLFAEDIKQHRPINEFGNIDMFLAEDGDEIYLLLLDEDGKTISFVIMQKQ